MARKLTCGGVRVTLSFMSLILCITCSCSAGAILYVLLCGFPPFDDSKSMSIFDQIKQGLVSFPSPQWDNISHAGTKHNGRSVMLLHSSYSPLSTH